MNKSFKLIPRKLHTEVSTEIWPSSQAEMQIANPPLVPLLVVIRL